MRRTIVQPADVSGAALAELKQWLAITRSDEDALLMDLITAGLDLCEAYTGQMPLEQTVEERVSTKARRTSLGTRPFRSLISAEAVAEDTTRVSLQTDSITIDQETEGGACFTLHKAVEGSSIAIRFVAGLASEWGALPSPLKQGVIRIAAHHYRDRDRDTDAKRDAPPPASVSALWRPWRSVRLT